MHTHVQPARQVDPGDTNPPLRPDRVRVSMSLGDMKWVIIVVAAGAIAWGVTTKNVADNTKRIDALEAENRTSRELLTRIDERTAAIKERLDRPGR